MITLEQIETAYNEAVADNGTTRYDKFSALEEMFDTFLVCYFSLDGELRSKVGLAIGNLMHNATNGWVTARGFQRMLDKGRMATHGNTKIKYTLEEMHETRDRCDKVAVENYDSLIKLLRENQ